MKRTAALPLLAAFALLAGCGGSDDAIQIDGAWARTSAPGQTTGAIYFQITADADDRLLGVSVPASVAADAQIHEVVMASSDAMSDDDMADMDDEMDDAMSGDMDGEMSDDEMDGEMSDDMGHMDGQMSMQELVDGLALPAGKTITLEPGGYHVMLLDISGPLEVGDDIELTLDFEEADDVTVTVDVAESAP